MGGMGMGCGCEPPQNDGFFGDNGAMMLLGAAIGFVVLYFVIKIAVENALKDTLAKSPLGNVGGGCGNNLF